MAHKTLNEQYIELGEKMMQRFDFSNTNYAANFQENIFQCLKKTSRPTYF